MVIPVAVVFQDLSTSALVLSMNLLHHCLKDEGNTKFEGYGIENFALEFQRKIIVGTLIVSNT